MGSVMYAFHSGGRGGDLVGSHGVIRGHMGSSGVEWSGVEWGGGGWGRVGGGVGRLTPLLWSPASEE